jgi:hypothetical protein
VLAPLHCDWLIQVLLTLYVYLAKLTVGKRARADFCRNGETAAVADYLCVHTDGVRNATIWCSQCVRYTSMNSANRLLCALFC